MNGIEALFAFKDISTQVYGVWKNAITNDSEESRAEISRLLERNLNELTVTSYQTQGFRARVVYTADIAKLVVNDGDDWFNRGDLFSGRSGINGFPADEMGPPPESKAGASRANRENVSYLYLASDVQTACAEVQPLCESLISVIEFQVKKGLSLIDFRTIPNDLRSFTDKDDPDKLIDIVFCQSLLKFFSIPVSAREQQLYCFSQYIAEILKDRGIDGILYSSSHNYSDNAHNLVLFDPNNAECVQDYGELYACLSIKSSFQSVSVNYRNDNLRILEAERRTDPYLWNNTAMLAKEIKEFRNKE